MVGCLLVSRFPLACELAERPLLRGRAAAVTGPGGAVWAASPAAERCGVEAGQPVREALGACPGLAVLEGRPARCQAIFEQILDSLGKIVFTVEPGAPGVAYAALDELAQLKGRPRTAAPALLACAPDALEPRLGIAPSRFAALAAAQAAPGGACLAVEPGELVGFLAGRPVEVLPVSTEMLRRLRLLGLVRLGELAVLPRSALAAQFGPEGALAWDLATGVPEAPLSRRRERVMVQERLALEPPLASLPALAAAWEQTLGRALRQPAMRGQAARRAVLRAETERGLGWERDVTFKEALSERERIWPAVSSAIAEAVLPGPVAEIALDLEGLTAARGRQLALPSQRGGIKERLEESLRQLKARYGYCPVGKVVEIEPWSRIPERRLALIDFDP
ncbi:MAG: DNA polymerase Y family protein [Candidatus Dormibacterales bacterium]